MMRLPEQVKEQIRIWKTEPYLELSKGAKGALVGHLNKVCGSDAARHKVLMYLFEKSSTKILSEQEWWALNCWVGAEQYGETWLPQENFVDEVECILGREPRVYYEFDRI